MKNVLLRIIKSQLLLSQCIFLALVSLSVSAAIEGETILAADIVSSTEMTPALKTGEMTYSILVNDQKIKFKLESNKTLLKHYSKQKKTNETKIFKGSIEGTVNSWARFTEQNGVITGAFYDGKSLYLIEKLDNFENSMASNALRGRKSRKSASDNITAVIDIADIEHNGTCALHGEKAYSKLSYNNYVADLRETLAISAAKEINITLVADTEYVAASNDAAVDMINALNIADGIFSEQLNVQLTLSDVVELNDNGTLTSTDPSVLIVDFRNTSTPNPGLRHLFTGKDLNGSTVGIAYVGSLCYNSSVSITQRFGTLTPIILAHELGHNFGAPHDNQGGSSCSSTPSGFIMNPSVSGGLSQFSSCSIEQINPYIEQATNGFNACISEIEVISPSPLITSTANLVANVGEDYQYDSDNTLDVDNSDSIIFTLDIYPTGMTIDSVGLISWLPTAEQVGSNPVQITVQNSNGRDTQFFEIEVSSDFINFQQTTLSSFDNQDKSGNTITSTSPFELELTGNNWKSIPFAYTVTKNTVLEFEFESEAEAEIHGIGFENDNKISRETTFNFFGNQDWGIQIYRYLKGNGKQAFSVPVGLFFQGDFNQLLFVLDNDLRAANANAVFRNVRVYESTQIDEPADFLDLSTLTFYTDLPEQDQVGTVTLTDDGMGVELVGNRWRKVLLDGMNITPTTVLEFDFKSSSIGDIHGLGFLPGNALDRTLSFQLFGTQKWGINDFKYTGNGEYQRFYIPVGKYFTQDSVELVFIMDHDVNNPNANSTFRNIVIRDTANTN